MSEKRFNYHYTGFESYYICDREKGEYEKSIFAEISDRGDAEEIVNRLNHLHEEKEDWKHKVGQLLFILKQFDEEKVKQLIEDLE